MSPRQLHCIAPNRSLLVTRSPDFTGTCAGATTSHFAPSDVSRSTPHLSVTLSNGHRSFWSGRSGKYSRADRRSLLRASRSLSAAARLHRGNGRETSGLPCDSPKKVATVCNNVCCTSERSRQSAMTLARIAAGSDLFSPHCQFPPRTSACWLRFASYIVGYRKDICAASHSATPPRVCRVQ